VLTETIEADKLRKRAHLRVVHAEAKGAVTDRVGYFNNRAASQRAGASSKPNKFAILPARAFSDKRLSALHHRVLGVIAMHDQPGRNGRGCL
jgi:hypothetical protein